VLQLAACCVIAEQTDVGLPILSVKVCPLNDDLVAVWGLQRCAVVLYSRLVIGKSLFQHLHALLFYTLTCYVSASL
jgi:hypothetical protein